MPVPEIFTHGSDIENNYPILIGVRADSFKPIKTSRSVAIHEARAQQTLSLATAVTHLKVPAIHTAEVTAILLKHSQTVPVLAIEDCERYAAELPFSKLVSGV